MAMSSNLKADSLRLQIGTYLHQGASDADAHVHNVSLETEPPFEGFGPLNLCDYEGFAGGVSDRVFAWIGAHDVALQELVGRVARAVTFVDYSTFKRDLLASYRDILGQLALRYQAGATGPFNFKDHAIVLVEGQKSNKWSAEIVLNETKDNPFAYVRLGEKDAREFVRFLESLDSLPDERKAKIREQFNDKTIVLFDDGSYSGKQIHDHLVAIQKANLGHQLQINCVALVIPNMTRYALDVINGFKAQNPKFEVLVARHNLIQTIYSLTEPLGGYQAAPLAVQRQVDQDRDQLARMWFKGDRSLLEKVGLIWGWAGHKVPNDVSFPEALAHGSVFDAHGQPIGKKQAYALIPGNTPCYKSVKSKGQEPLPNFYKVPNTKKNGEHFLYRGAMPTRAGMEILDQIGVRVMVNLREKPYDADQMEFLSKKKIKVVHIPFDYDRPDIKQVVEFVGTYFLANRENQKVFVHCRHGADRTGVMVAALKLVAKKDPENVIQEMLDPKYGFHRLTHPNLVEFVQSLNAEDLRKETQIWVQREEKRDSGFIEGEEASTERFTFRTVEVEARKRLEAAPDITPPLPSENASSPDRPKSDEDVFSPVKQAQVRSSDCFQTPFSGSSDDQRFFSADSAFEEN